MSPLKNLQNKNIYSPGSSHKEEKLVRCNAHDRMSSYPCHLFTYTMCKEERERHSVQPKCAELEFIYERGLEPMFERFLGIPTTTGKKENLCSKLVVRVDLV